MAVFAPTVVYPTRLRDPLGGRSGGGTTGFEGREVLGLLRGAGVAAVERQYTCGEILFAEGDWADGLYVLAEGAVKLSKGYLGGNEITLMLLGPWEVFGDLAFGCGTYQHARAKAMTDCRVSKVPKLFVARFLKTRPEMALKVVDLLRLVRQREMTSCLLPHKAETKWRGCCRYWCVGSAKRMRSGW